MGNNIMADNELEVFKHRNEILKSRNKLVKHFKGKFYLIEDFAQHTETGEILVIYRALYGEAKLYERPLDMFVEEVDKVKYPEVKQRFRFEIL